MGDSVDSIPRSSVEDGPSTKPQMQVVRLADLEVTVQSLVTTYLEKLSAKEINSASGGEQEKKGGGGGGLPTFWTTLNFYQKTFFPPLFLGGAPPPL